MLGRAVLCLLSCILLIVATARLSHYQRSLASDHSLLSLLSDAERNVLRAHLPGDADDSLLQVGI